MGLNETIAFAEVLMKCSVKGGAAICDSASTHHKNLRMNSTHHRASRVRPRNRSGSHCFENTVIELGPSGAETDRVPFAGKLGVINAVGISRRQVVETIRIAD